MSYNVLKIDLKQAFDFKWNFLTKDQLIQRQIKRSLITYKGNNFYLKLSHHTPFAMQAR